MSNNNLLEENNLEIKRNEIVVLILATKNENYSEFESTISEGWVAEMQKNGIKCFLYLGGNKKSSVHGNKIYTSTADTLEHTAEKLLVAFKILLKLHPKIKLVYRTNLSSFIDVQNFIQFINLKKLNQDTYTGLVGKTTYLKEKFFRNRLLTKLFTIIPIGKRIKFASGSGFFIGRNRIDQLLASPSINLRLIDDVMVAEALDIEPDYSAIPLRFDLMADGTHKITIEEYRGLIEEGLLFHYRFKTSNRIHDVEMMKLFNSTSNRYNICTLNK